MPNLFVSFFLQQICIRTLENIIYHDVYLSIFTKVLATILDITKTINSRILAKEVLFWCQ